MGKGKKIGIGIGISVAVIFLIFAIIYAWYVSEIEEGAQTARVEVVWNGDNHTFDFKFFFSDKDGSPVRANGEMEIEIVSRSDERYAITEQITFEKDEFLAYQNNFGATIIELQKEVKASSVFSVRDADGVFFENRPKGTYDVYVDIKTSTMKWDFDPIDIYVN